jgi:type VI secretion system protein ImpJ
LHLKPHQLQAAQRFDAVQRGRGAKWDLHYNWGLRSIDLNAEALANHRLVVRSLQARLRDGTLVSVPEDAALQEVDLKGPLERDRSLKVFLAVPKMRLGRANVATDGQAEAGRYFVDSQELEDENTGLNPQPIQVRRLNAKLILDNQDDHPGYDALPIARVEKSQDADATPRLDPTYIPPVLACDAWPYLSNNLLRGIYDQIGIYVDLLADQAEGRGIGVGSHAPEDALILGQLRALNEAYAVQEVLAYADGVHPLLMYTELCRLVGQLAIFSKERRPPKLPHYDHDDLGTLFHRIRIEIDKCLRLIEPPNWTKKPFEWVAPRMQVDIKPEWLEPAWQVFVGVQSPLPADHCIRLLTSPGQLDMKIGSADRVDGIFTRSERGLRFAHTPSPPSLPKPQGLIYFQVDRGENPAEWQSVRSSLTLAVRLNERRVVSAAPRQESLTITLGTNQNTQMSFWLYLLRNPNAAPAPRQ